MAGNIALPLQEFIASLHRDNLPKILQVCSGVYFQGSIYEISGTEVCFSTGDLIKVIGIELQSVSCEDISNNEKFELPVNHTGRFRVVPEEMPYSSVEEMMSLRPVELESCLPFTFTSYSKMTFGGLSLGASTALTVVSIERRQGQGQEDQVCCRVRGQQDASAEVRVPLSSRGQFYECESEECFTLKEILSSPCLRSRRFRFVKATKCEQSLVLSPVYQVHAIMSLRKNLLKFPSSLEVDVVDVTDECKDVDFVTPLTLTEVVSQPDESFPVVVEILEAPETRSMFKCSWLPELNKSAHLVLHKKGTTTMFLFSSLKSRKPQQYFLVSENYGGRFRRRPREFNSVYELYVASTQTPSLKVNVTRNCEEVEEEGIPALGIGEHLEIVSCTRMELPCDSSKDQSQSVEALLCRRLQEPADDDDEDDEDDQQDVKEEMLLPLYMQGHFVEVLGDNKKYKLCDLSKNVSLPLDVKVVSRDSELETDPLAGLGCLRTEGILTESTIQASFPHRPDCCFEIPAQWLSLSVSFTKDPLPWPQGEAPKLHVEKVTEMTDAFFYEFHKKGSVDEAPPPRPPKRNLSSSKSTKKASKKINKASKANKSKNQTSKSVPTQQFSNLTLNHKRRPPAPLPPDDVNDQPPPIAPRKNSEVTITTSKALPNTYVKIDQPKKTGSFSETSADVDSDHDYEIVDEPLAVTVKAAQESVKFY
ncbi:protein THEMIS2 [Cololabis saira]|uniref:protein THEMIS2 n=1 Tax=Cololabis saira TaxID=129043 RepID=UPI002AD34A23|nr:protein THEMIS2 [Cololabis saira]